MCWFICAKICGQCLILIIFYHYQTDHNICLGGGDWWITHDGQGQGPNQAHAVQTGDCPCPLPTWCPWLVVKAVTEHAEDQYLHIWVPPTVGSHQSYLDKYEGSVSTYLIVYYLFDNLDISYVQLPAGFIVSIITIIYNSKLFQHNCTVVKRQVLKIYIAK